MRGVLRRLLQGGHHHLFDLVDGDRDRPSAGRGSSAKPSNRSVTKRERNLPTVAREQLNFVATALLAVRSARSLTATPTTAPTSTDETSSPTAHAPDRRDSKLPCASRSRHTQVDSGAPH